jgi:hypothetical protein
MAAATTKLDALDAKVKALRERLDPRLKSDFQLGPDERGPVSGIRAGRIEQLQPHGFGFPPRIMLHEPTVALGGSV